MIRSDRRVTYYDPLTRYELLDIVRIGLVVLSIAGTVFVLFLARQRWRETRHSAAYFLVAIAVGLTEVGLGSALALGHPFNWTIPIRVAFVVICQVASLNAVREYRRPGGLWDKPPGA